MFDFKIEKSKFKIGSKMFPVASKAKTKILTHNNTRNIDYPKFFDALDFIQFEAGRCYTNAELVNRIGHNLGLNTQYYAGWVFFGDAPPVHHAWVVLDDEAVIDTSISIEEFKILFKYSKAVMNDEPNWRDKVAKEIAEYKKNKKPTSHDTILGQVPEFVTYVGSPDNIEHAKKLFRDLSHAFPNHPSYTRKMNMLGASEIQKKVLAYSV